MPELRQLSDDDFSALLGTIDVETAPSVDRSRLAYRERVALASSFDISTLVNEHGDRDKGLDDFVQFDCELVTSPSGLRWRLRPDVRAAVLSELDGTSLQALAAGSGGDDDIATAMATRYIKGIAPPLATQTVAELRGTALAAEWLADTQVATPSVLDVRAHLTIAETLEPLRSLLAHGFVGRQQELATLKDYVEVLPASSKSRAVTRRIRRMLKFDERPPLVIHGPGGIGKSTLVAKFILDHIDREDDARFPFAYLTFDRTELRLDQPLTLLADAALQLGALFPNVAKDANDVAAAARQTVAATYTSSRERRASKSSSERYHDRNVGDERALLQRFAEVIADAAPEEQTTLWVLDTFEVAQRAGSRAVDQLFGFLERFQNVCPRLRVVFAGRAPIEGHRTMQLHLEHLDPASARHLLEIQLTDLDLPDEFISAVANTVASQSPVSLRIAADTIRKEAATGLQTERRRREVLFSLRVGDVDGVLYRRILDHLADPDVRKLAHPGLVVRRITPDVIEHVLAKPCGLGDVGPDRARHLFDMLALEHSLVARASSDALVHRRDVRAVMLPMIERDEPALTASLRRRAVRYYRLRSSFIDRVEELYYRLALGQSTRTLDEAFDIDAGRMLEDALDELPPQAQVYLAGRLGLSVLPDVLAEADDLAWQRHAAAEGRRLIDAGRADDALQLVTSRPSVTSSETAALEIEVLAVLRDHSRALDRADVHLAWATEHGEGTMYLDLALLAARIAEDLGEYERANELLHTAAETATTMDDDIGAITAQVAMARIARRQGASSDASLDALAQAADRLTVQQRRANLALVRDLAAELGDRRPELTIEALRSAATEPEPAKKGRRSRPAAPAATSKELGEAQSSALEESASESDYAEYTAALQAESDEAAF